MISFAPINLMYKRLEASQTESDVNYFFDLLLMGGGNGYENNRCILSRKY